MLVFPPHRQFSVLFSSSSALTCGWVGEEGRKEGAAAANHEIPSRGGRGSRGSGEAERGCKEESLLPIGRPPWFGAGKETTRTAISPRRETRQNLESWNYVRLLPIPPAKVPAPSIIVQSRLQVYLLLLCMTSKPSQLPWTWTACATAAWTSSFPPLPLSLCLPLCAGGPSSPCTEERKEGRAGRRQGKARQGRVDHQY